MSLKDRLDEETQTAEAWRPEPNEELIGIVRRYNMRKMDDGSEYPIVTIETPDGEKHAWHAFHKVGRDQLEEDKPRPGDEIGVRYLGKVDGETYSYHNYRVAVDHKTPEPPAGSDTPSDDQDGPGPSESDFQPAPVGDADQDIPF
jgi:hypothetical protein